MPLVVALHGLGGDEDGWMDRYNGQLPELAEKYGYIAVSPLGYRPDGFYGYGTVSTPPPAEAELSEQDVMQVLARMRQHYKVDDSRIYLMGHSMGAIGTWFLGAKYPDIWAALGTIAGTGNPQSIARMRHIPQFVVHGDADPTVPVGGSREHGGGDEEAGRGPRLRRGPGRQPHGHRGAEPRARCSSSSTAKRKAPSTSQ